MTTKHEAPAAPEPEPDPEECPENQPPLFLLGPDELPYLLHPAWCVRYREDRDFDDPGVEYVLIRNEDYRERDEDGWIYGGLIPKVKAVFEYDADVTPEERAEIERSLPEEWETPASFACPKCGGATYALDDMRDGDEFRPYQCGACFWSMALESRDYIANAAVLILDSDPPLLM